MAKVNFYRKVWLGSAEHKPVQNKQFRTEIKKSYCYFLELLVGTALSVWRFATGWNVRGSNPGGSGIFRNRPDQPWAPPNFLHTGHRVSFAGVEWPRPGIGHLTPSISEVKESVLALVDSSKVDLNSSFYFVQLFNYKCIGNLNRINKHVSP